MFLERYKFRGIFRERYFKIHFERRREAFIDQRYRFIEKKSKGQNTD